MLKITDLSVHYGRVRAVQNLTLEVNQGELVGLVGEVAATGRDLGAQVAGADPLGRGAQPVELVAELLTRIAARGVAILLVEQKLTIALRISARLYVMGHGRIVFEGTPASLQAAEQVRKEWLEV